MDKTKLAAALGTDEYNAMPAFNNYDELKMNGQSGTFVLTRYSQEKGADGYEAANVAEPVRIVFLKPRRKFLEFADKQLVAASHEYNSRKQSITLSDGTVHADEKALKAARPNGKVVVVQYGLYKFADATGVVKLPVSGMSLYSEDDEPLRFYNYMQAFNKDEHAFEYITEVTTTPLQGDKGVYYAMAFKKADHLDDNMLGFVEAQATKLLTELAEEDARNAKRLPTVGKKATASDASTDKAFNDLTAPSGIEYPEEDINPDDIPF